MAKEELTEPNPADQEILKKLQDLVGKELAQVPKIEWDTRGYVVDEAGAVVGLGLYECEIDDRKLKELAETLGTLTSLTTLGLSYNPLTDISALGTVTSLTTLDLSVNRLTNISGLGTVTSLSTLDLSSNQLTDISALGTLTSLTTLYLSANQLTDISALGTLTSLTTLYLSRNQLTDISALGTLTSLTTLDLSGNQLADISALGNVTSLTTLDLWSNQLTDISALGTLTSLAALSLWSNQLTDISGLGELGNLTQLGLYRNKIKELPEWITELGMEIYCDSDSHETGIDLEDNPLETPPVEIVKKGREAIRRYFADRERTGTRPINEVKVLLVGDGGAGKTCLVKRVIYNTYNPKEKKTHGIYIDHWPIKITGRDITVHFWDFGGQGIMQATHQLFFSVRSLYILVVNARQEADPEDWFKSIVSYGGDSPILVVINKIDENPYNLNEKDLQRKYPNIKRFFHISCKDGTGIADFQEQLQKHLAGVEMLESDWPSNRAKVREALEKLNDDYIDYRRYQRICVDNQLADEDSQLDLLATLNDLGVITYFDLPGLKHRQVLKPDWVTGAIYRIINSRRLKGQHGIMPRAELEYVLNEELLEDEKKRGKRQTYNVEERDYIVGLMKQFELCYVLSNGDCERVVVPDLLVVKESDYHLNGPVVVRLRLRYDFLPRSVLGRFMVQQHGDLNIKESWRTGAVLKSPLHKTKAVVKVDDRERQIDIEVAGEQAHEHLAAIRDTLWGINRELRLKPSEWIPLPDSEQPVEYEELLGHRLDGRDEYYNGKLRKTFSVRTLLDGIETSEEQIARILQSVGVEAKDIKGKTPQAIFNVVTQNIIGKDAKGLQAGEMRDYREKIDESVIKELIENINIGQLTKILERKKKG